MEQKSGPDDSKDISSKSTPCNVLIPKTEIETLSEGLASNVSLGTGLEKKLDSPSSGVTKSGSSTSFPTSQEGYKQRFLHTYSQYQISTKRPGCPVKSSGPVRSVSEKRTTKQSSEWISKSLLDAGQETKSPSPKKLLHKSSGDISQFVGIPLTPVIVEQPRTKALQREIEKAVPLSLDSGFATNTRERKAATTTPEKQSEASPVIKNFEPQMRQLLETLEEIKYFWKRISGLADVYDTVTSIPWIQLSTAGPTRPQSNFEEQEKVEGFASVLSSLARALLRPDLSGRLRQACHHATWPEDADLFENSWCLDITSYELNSKVNKKVLDTMCSISETTAEIQSFVLSSSDEAHSLEILGYLISTRALEKEFRDLHITFTAVDYDIHKWATPKREIDKDFEFPKFRGGNIELANRLLDISLLLFNLLIKYQTLNYEFAKTFPDRLGRILQDKHIPKAPMMTSSTGRISQ